MSVDVCVSVCMLYHFLILIVMRCHVQVINADMFITQPASVLSCVAIESLDDISSLYALTRDVTIIPEAAVNSEILFWYIRL